MLSGHFFGESYYTLNIAGILLNNLWTIIWFLVAVELLGTKHIKLMAFMFTAATPLIQTLRITIYTTANHMTVSTLTGLCTLFLLKSFNCRVPGRNTLYLILSGIVASISFFYSYSAIFYIVGYILYMGLKERTVSKNMAIWLSAFFLPFIFYFRAVHWRFFSSATAFHMEISPRQLLMYFGGIPKNPTFFLTETDLSNYYYYSSISMFYSLLLIVMTCLYLAGRHYRSSRRFEFRQASPELWAFGLSNALFLLAITTLSWYAALDTFDGLRYLIPVTPYYLLLILYYVKALDYAPATRIMVGVYAGVTVFGYMMHMHPFNDKSDIYRNIAGWNAVHVLTAPDMLDTLSFENAAAERAPRYAFMIGAAFQNNLDLPDDLARLRPKALGLFAETCRSVRHYAIREFLRGYAFRAHDSILNEITDNGAFLSGNPASVRPLIEGAGMSLLNSLKTIWDGETLNRETIAHFDNISDIYDSLSSEHRKHLVWGLGRELIHFPAQEQQLIFEELTYYISHEAFQQGIIDGLKYDFFNDPLIEAPFIKDLLFGNDLMYRRYGIALPELNYHVNTRSYHLSVQTNAD